MMLTNPRLYLTSATALVMTLTLVLPQAATMVQGATPQGTQSDLAQDPGSGKEASASGKFAREAGRLVGVWEAQVTRRVCATGDAISTFRGMTNFITGGALIGTNSNPNPPTTYGRWRYLGGDRYIAVERLFRYNADGTFAGVQRITRNITLVGEGHFTGVNTSQVFDVGGNLISTGCTTDITQRVE
jgi:hypothetical protein